MDKSKKQRIRLSLSIAFALSSLLFLPLVIFSSLGEVVGPLFEYVPYGPITWLTTLVFGAGNDERGILFVLTAVWTTYVFIPIAISTYLLLTVISRKAQSNSDTNGQVTRSFRLRLR